jgi:signal transduction histidine kinase
MGFIHLLEDFESTEKEERNLYIGEVKKSTTRLVKVISDVLELSLIESGNIVLRNKPIDLFPFLNSIVENYQVFAQAKGIQLESKCLSNGEAIVFHNDPIKLRLILSHLIDNALKFTLKGKVTIWCKEDARHMLIGIHDTGIGISEANRPYIFDRFWQAEAFQKTFFGGNGLGLPIVEGLSNAMNIQLNFSSVEAEGSEFVLTIPKNIDS